LVVLAVGFQPGIHYAANGGIFSLDVCGGHAVFSRQCDVGHVDEGEFLTVLFDGIGNLSHVSDASVCFGRLLEVRGSRPGKNVQLTENEIRGLCLKSREIFLSQPILLELEAPLKICGKESLFQNLIQKQRISLGFRIFRKKNFGEKSINCSVGSSDCVCISSSYSEHKYFFLIFETDRKFGKNYAVSGYEFLDLLF
jgi:hypothetical protein